jgi:prepilin-type N-terminal cleavage/methylation domain-containing protein
MRREVKSGFTLAEVLITLAIIGVVASISIPAVMGSTNQQEYKTAFKKAVSVLNQAITTSIALDATDTASCTDCSAAGAPGGAALANYFRNKLNVTADGPDGNSFYTSDGFLYQFYKNAATPCDVSNSTTSVDFASAACIVLVDVNGQKGPNMLSSGSEAIAGTGSYKDQYYVIIKDTTAIGGVSGTNTIAQDAQIY